MATANPLEDELSCSVCFDMFTEPRILRECFHTFCHECIKKLEQGGRVQCPECRAITESEHIKKDFKTQRLIDVFQNQNETSKGNPLKRKCGMCKKSKEVKSQCSQCDHNMCADCEVIHKSMKLAKDHNVKQITDIIKCYESILKKDVDDLEKQMKNANQKSSQFNKGIENAERARVQQQSDVKAYTENAIKELQKNQIHLEQVIDEANDNLIRQLTKGKELCNESKTEIQSKIDFLNQMIRGQDIDTLSETTSTVDISIKEDIEKIKASLDKTDTCMDSPVSVEKGKDWDAMKCVDVKIDDVPHHSNDVRDELQMVYSDMIKYKYKLVQNTELDYVPYKLCLIGNELWCIGNDGVFVYNSDCKLIRTITHTNFTGGFALTQSGTGYIIVACGGTAGLYQIDPTGKFGAQISKGSYCDIVTYNGFLYALNEKLCNITIFTYSNRKWSQLKSFNLEGIQPNTLNRMCVNSSGIHVSSFTEHSMYKYSLDGQFQKQVKRSDKLPLTYPLVCSTDSNGHILLSSFGDKCLQICCEDGHLEAISLPGLNSHPMHAVVGKNGQVWIITQQATSLLKFVMTPKL